MTNLLNASLLIKNGNNFYVQSNFYDAIDAYRKALILQPNSSQAYTNLGNALSEVDNLDEALEAQQKAISIKPDYAIAYNNLGSVLYKQGKFNDALDACKKSINIKPDYAQAYNNIGNTLKHQGKIDTSIKFFQKAISLQPKNPIFQFDYSFALLQAGKIKEGLEEYEWRWKTPKFLLSKRHFSQPYWDGKKSLIGKKILVWSEQGIGETLIWSSCLPILSSLADKCILECQPKLVPLLQRSFPNVEVRHEDRKSDLNRNDFDFHLPMGSLYKCLFDDIIKITKPSSYLVPDPDRVTFWRNRLASLGSGPYVGITWCSSLINSERKQNKNMSSISEWGPILKTPDITFINLQVNNFHDDLIKARNKFGVEIHDFKDLDQYDNIDDTSALYASLDMVISHSHSPHIISSAVGTPTKLATNRIDTSDMNFLHAVPSTSIDIFLRDADEAWEDVFCLIAKDLLKLKKSY